MNDEDKIESAYRFLLADLMPFGENAVIRLEHGGTNESTDTTRRSLIGTGFRRPRSSKPTDCRSGILRLSKSRITHLRRPPRHTRFVQIRMGG